ncbi:MAG: hypothetical protein AUG00_00980 [Candidatus Rokubacteria bacterium 13_1_20CM_2_70_7]|nr:MAG: hypothetical protein AUG00_00980 [Candidatus Rokubacteria bacterium 13_1_20CM_2_70_7]
MGWRGRRDLELARPHLAHAGHLARHLHRALQRGGALEGHDTALGLDGDAVATCVRMHRQRDLHAGGQRSIGNDLPSGPGRRQARVARGALDHLDGGLVRQLLAVDHQVVQRGVPDVDLVEVTHPARLLVVVAPDELGGGALVRRLAGHLRRPFDPLLDTLLEGGDHPHAQHVGDPAQQPLATAPHQDDVVGLGELQQRRLENGDVVARLGVEALEQRRLRLIEV